MKDTIQSAGELFLAAVIVATLLLLSGCQPAGTYAEGESGGYTYKNQTGAKIPVDDNIYTITGVVAGDVNSIQRQVGPARVTTYRSDTYSESTYFPPAMNGKGLVRLWVEESDFPGVPPETIAIVKATDTKLIAVLPGDRITLRCRVQAEAIAPSYTSQTYDAEKAVTLELDYCRMLSPVIDVEQTVPDGVGP